MAAARARRLSSLPEQIREARIGHHDDVPLSETTLLNVAGDLVYARGEDYVRYVRGLRVTDFKAYASIQAKNVYSVELDWSGPLPDGSCTCPHHADGNFCKHMVATGLPRSTPDASPPTTQPAIRMRRRWKQSCRRWTSTSCVNWS